MTYQVFTAESPGRMSLPDSPSSVWVISTLEIAVGWQGEHHLMLVHPSYPLAEQINSPSHDEGYWAPPFVAYPVPIDFSPPTTVGSLWRLATEAVDRIDVVRDLNHLAYQMGLRDIELRQRSPFLELKISPRSPSLVKAYYILRHGLIGVDASSCRNLADPEQRRGYVFLPLGQYRSATQGRYSVEHERNERWFLGKPIMSNIEHVLDDDMRRLAISEEGIGVQPALFNRVEQGILCVVDLAGYGAALRYAFEHMHTFSTSAIAAQEDFRRRMAEEMHTMLGDIGTTQAQFAGDGFVAAFPERVYPDINKLISAILIRWERLIGLVEKLNNAIRDPMQRVGTRIVLHRGAYTYGRVAGPRSFAAAFDGTSIIEVVRLEQGLAADAKRRSTDMFTSLPHRSHLLAVSTSLDDTLGVAQRKVAFARWTQLGQAHLVSKEYDGDALVYRFPTPDGEQ
ncbi:hypothetical protein [Actinomadura luteofluorescens]